MKAVVQRVSSARVVVPAQGGLPGTTVGAIGPGVVILVGVARQDEVQDAAYLSEKIAGLRIFPDEAGRFARSLVDVGGEALVVSQFTLLADTRRGRRPSFARAAPPEAAEPLVEAVLSGLRERRISVAAGRFGAQMDVELHNDGPVTIVLDSTERHMSRRSHAAEASASPGHSRWLP